MVALRCHAMSLSNPSSTRRPMNVITHGNAKDAKEAVTTVVGDRLVTELSPRTRDGSRGASG